MGKTMKGGDKMQKHLENLARKVENANQVRVGFLEGATYPDGTGVAEVAAYQEFGTNKIPPRPFFRNAIKNGKGNWAKELAKIMEVNDMDASISLGRMGTRIAGQIAESIIDFTDPALAKSTIAAKGFDKPLIDTGHMINSIDFEVK